MSASAPDLSRWRVGEFVSSTELVDAAAAIMVAAGMPREDAQRTADILVFAQKSGIDSHGLTHLPSYIQNLRTGASKAHPDMCMEGNFGATAVLDADCALGPLAGVRACDAAYVRAMEFGIGLVAVRNSSHFGVASAFANYLAEQGAISLIMSTASATVAPRGSRTAMFGTNPIAAGFPRAGGEPVLIDFATTAGARARIRKAAREKTPIPADWALDKEGKATTDADAALLGTMQALGGEKGTVLPLLVELLCVALSGGAMGTSILVPQEPSGRPRGISHVFFAIDATAFGGLEQVALRTGEIASAVEGSASSEPGRPVRMPGAQSGARRAHAAKHGIEMTAALHAALEEASSLVQQMPKTKSAHKEEL